MAMKKGKVGVAWKRIIGEQNIYLHTDVYVHAGILNKGKWVEGFLRGKTELDGHDIWRARLAWALWGGFFGFGGVRASVPAR
jgi:hypothetical protein